MSTNDLTKSFTMWPTWLAESGMPLALCRGSTRGSLPWLLATLLILRDIRTDGLHRSRCGDRNFSFEWGCADLARQAATCHDALTRNLAAISAGAWLQYDSGRGGRPSVFTINRDIIRKLYEYHAPRAPASAFGLQDIVSGDKRTSAPRLIYGHAKGSVQPVTLNETDMIRLWHARLQYPKFADPREVRDVLGLP